MIPIVPAVGDFVQARVCDDDILTVTEFTITKISGTKFTGGPARLGVIDTTAGWTVEVIRKGDPGLPTELSFIAAVFANSPAYAVKLVGHDDDWQLDGGGRVEVSEILGWMLWADYTALTA